MVGDDYDFFIQTTDADGDDLNLTVTNLPSGLVFDWETDTITGNPDSSAVSSEDGAFKEYAVVIAIDDSVFLSQEIFHWRYTNAIINQDSRIPKGMFPLLFS